VNSTAVLELQVQNHDLRTQREDGGRRGLRQPGVADDENVACRRQEIAEPLPNDVVVVQQLNLESPPDGTGGHESVLQHPTDPHHRP